MPAEHTGSSRRLLCLGLGYTAEALTRRLQHEGGWEVTGSTRSAARAAAMRGSGVSPLLWTEGPLPTSAVEESDAVLVSAAPEADGCPVLAGAGEALAAHAGRLSWIGYLSSTAVYGDHGGAWVDESSEARGVASTRGARRLAAERAWRDFGQETGTAVVVFRLSGIYGPGRSAVDSVRAGRARRVFKPGQVFSRAHVDDIAAVLAASLAQPAAGDLFNVADDEPAPPQDVTAYACELLGVPVPPLLPIERAGLSPAALAFYADNRRVDNTRIRDRLGVSLRYPTYREGLGAIAARD